MCSLTTLTVQEGFLKNKHGNRRYRLGIDIRYILFIHASRSLTSTTVSIWFAEGQHAFKHGGAQSGSQPELKVVFSRLAGLLRLPVDVLFVFDGDQRPEVKRNTNVVKKAHWMTENAKLLIRAFGFSFYVASSNCVSGNAL
jgi:Holliday junction resolvase YEN1